nr:prolyl oligopeptidase family protein [Tanacetum cinerariifolium]
AATGLHVQHERGGDQGALLPRSKHLGVPKFLGVDPETWLFSINEYFTLLKTATNQQLRIVRFNLKGAVTEWFRWMTRKGLITDWPRFEESVKNRYGPSMYEDPQGALSKELLVSKPTTLDVAFTLARIMKARLEDQGTVSGDNKGASTSDESPYQRAVKTPLLPTPPKANGDESLRMKKIGLHRMQALLEQDEVYSVYEIYHLPLEADVGKYKSSSRVFTPPRTRSIIRKV